MKQIALLVEDRDAAEVKPTFARHETFHPRFGWLRKGYEAAKSNPQIFLEDDATVRLGVGKNMVRAIRFWCQAFKLLDERRASGERSRPSNPTDFGVKLLEDDGWDPYLEDPASLWLLHWNLLRPTCEAAAWYYAFNSFHQAVFSPDELLGGLQGYRDTHSLRVADNSLKKDVTCLLRMYVASDAKTGPSEDSIDCPFAELGLIRRSGDVKRYQFHIGAKANLPAEVVVAACLEFAAWAGSQKTISIARLAYDPGSPGLVFKLNEAAIFDAIELVAGDSRKLNLSDAAGLIQFSFTGEPAQLARGILDRYYRGTNGKE